MAQASALSDALAAYITLKVKPTRTERGVVPGIIPTEIAPMTYIWDSPSSLRADEVTLAWMGKAGRDAWSLGIYQPRSKLISYMGTTQLSFRGRRRISLQRPQDYMNVYIVQGGPFRGYLVQDGMEKGSRVISLMTPAMARRSPVTAEYLKSST